MKYCEINKIVTKHNVIYNNSHNQHKNNQINQHKNNQSDENIWTTHTQDPPTPITQLLDMLKSDLISTTMKINIGRRGSSTP